MFKVIDEVFAIDLEPDDIFEEPSEGVVTLKEKVDKDSVVFLIVLDRFEDSLEIYLDPFEPIELLMEVPDNE